MRIPLGLGVLLLLLTSACNSPQGTPIHKLAATINATRGPIEDAIVPGDTLDLVFANFTAIEREDLTRIGLVVSDDGILRMPGVESMLAVGRTPDELAAELIEAYEPVLGSAPAVSVTISARVPRMFHVLGAVEAPGAFDVLPHERVTLPEALAKAGGVQYLTAYMGNILLIRWDMETDSQLSWVLDARPKWWDESDTVVLQANDVIYVPDTSIAKVNAWLERYIIRMIPFPRIFYGS